MSKRAAWGLVATSGGGWTKRLEQLQVPWIPVPLAPSSAANLVRSAVLLRKAVRQHGIELIHSHHRFASLVGRLVAHWSSIPFVSTVHDMTNGQRAITRYALGE